MDGITKLFFAKEGVVISDLFLWCSITRQERKRNVEKYCLNCREWPYIDVKNIDVNRNGTFWLLQQTIT